MAELFANAAQSTLAASITAAATSLSVASAASFPTTGNFRIVIDSELMLVTAASGTTFTVTRAVEAYAGVQTAAAHGAGAIVTHVLTAAGLQNVAGPTGPAGPTGATGPAGAGFGAGFIAPYAGSSAPAGWLPCDGSAVARSTYAALFAAIGTTWGAGDGSTTFNVPDLRDRVVLGSSPGSLSGNRPTARTLGATGGEETHLLDVTEMPGHTHSIISWGDNAQFFTGLANANVYLEGTSPNDNFTDTTIAGSSQPHNVMQPFAVINWLIKT